jgi:hypothetical protein
MVVAAGDCLAPRTVEEAVLEGLRAGLAVDTGAVVMAPSLPASVRGLSRS